MQLPMDRLVGEQTPRRWSAQTLDGTSIQRYDGSYGRRDRLDRSTPYGRILVQLPSRLRRWFTWWCVCSLVRTLRAIKSCPRFRVACFCMRGQTSMPRTRHVNVHAVVAARNRNRFALSLELNPSCLTTRACYRKPEANVPFQVVQQIFKLV
jgi:hypothetical protein